MTLQQFIQNYDKKNSIVLLEGKRNVIETDKQKLIALGKILTVQTKHILFRSGNAEGADHYFSQGVLEIDRCRLQTITPYSGHRKKENKSYETISLDEINIAQEPEVVYQSKQNKKMGKLIDKYVSGDKNKYSIKAAYIIRDTIKAIGTKGIMSAIFGIFYDDLKNPQSGGTGHTMNICSQNNIPIINQTVWLDWIK